MKTKIIYAFMFMLTAMLAACSDNDLLPSVQAPTLQVSVNTDNVVNGRVVSTLPGGSSIGVTVVDKSGTAYEDNTYNNVCYTTADGVDWSTDSPFTFGKTEATGYAYYPYSASITDVTAIPVTSADTEFLRATPVRSLSATNSQAAFDMYHILAEVVVNIINTNDEAVTLSGLDITSSGFCDSGTLNIMDGTVTSDGTKKTVSFAASQSIGNTAVQKEFLVLPTGKGDNVIFSAVIEGNKYTLEHAINIQGGYRYAFNLYFGVQKLTLSGVSITPWSTEKKNFELTDDVLQRDNIIATFHVPEAKTFYTYSSYYPSSGREEITRDFDYIKVNSVQQAPSNTYVATVPGNYIVEYGLKGSLNSLGTYAFHTCPEMVAIQFPAYMTSIRLTSMSNLKSITCLSPIPPSFFFYNIRSGGTLFVPQGCSDAYSTWLDKLSGWTIKELEIPNETVYVTYNKKDNCQILDTSVFDISKVKRMTVNGVEVTPSATFTFTTTPYSVGFEFIDASEIPDYAFWSSEITGLYIPPSVRVIGYNSFGNCENLGGTLYIPDSVEKISDEAFSFMSGGCNLVLGKNVKYIGRNAFHYMAYTRKITIHATTPPEVSLGGMYESFNGFPSGGTLYVPVGCSTAYSSWITGDTGFARLGWTIAELTE